MISFLQNRLYRRLCGLCDDRFFFLAAPAAFCPPTT
jgi:hypothetical protein